MNRIFKTIWSDVRQGYIVANEAQKTHGKPAKSAVSFAVAAATFLAAGVASAGAYVEPGLVAQNSSQITQAKTSWETAEYKKDWGLTAMNASSAYALGYHGQNTAVGVMDSGALLQAHPDLNGDRFHGSIADAEYGSTGQRYPQHTNGDMGDYKPGQGAGTTIDGNWIKGTNDSHGTHVTGTVGANRDGNEFHGVSWGSDIWVGNTGGTDDTNYGPFQDYKFFYSGWSALANNLIAQNGEKRGGVINNSFGTNTRIVSVPDRVGADGFNTSTMFKVDTVEETEYEYFLFNQVYGNNPSFVDAAYDAVKNTNVVQVMTTGNRDMKNPYYRALYPYFNPEAEEHWIAVAGLKKLSGEGDSAKYGLIKNFNEAGNAKWWTVVGPGDGIYSSTVGDKGRPGYDAWGGTSMAAPHVSGAMGVLMSRYQDMSAIQVRDVLFTTASHTNPDDTNFDGWNNVDGTTPKEGEVSDRMGWGLPDLEKGMYGLGQLLGHFEYDMSSTPLDVWSNDISQVALDQREREDLAWKTAAEKWLKNPTLTLGDEYTAEEKKLLGNIMLDSSDDVVGLTDEQEKIAEADAIAWRKAYYQKRIDAINSKIDQGLYDGALTKRGQGTLVMTGNNTYRGGTTVEGGTLLGFNDSFGIGKDGTGNGTVTVNGGVFGVMNTYNDQFTMKGELTNSKNEHSVDVVVNKGGSYGVVAGQDVNVGKLTFNEGAGVTVVSTDTDVLVDTYNGKASTGSVTAETLTGNANIVANPDYAFFKTDIKVEGNKITATLSRDEKSSVATYATTANRAAIANVLNGATNSEAFGAIVGLTKDQVHDSLAGLTDDLHMAAQNATVVNSLGLARVIKDQATGIGQAQTAETESGARIWATGTASWGEADYGSSVDVDTYTGFLGAEIDVANASKVGLFFGYGSTDFDSDHNGKIESDDIHFGVYGQTGFDQFNTTYGFSYTNQSRDANRAMSFAGQTGNNAVNYDTNIAQIFGEVAYSGLNNAAYSVEPYFGLTYMHVENDAFTESVGKYSFETKGEDADLFVTSLGVRGAMPFTIGTINMQAKADLAWNHFFGDNEPEATLRVHDAGVVMLTGEELSDTATVGLGVEAQLTKTTTFGVNYTGSFGSDIDSHGIGASLRVNF